jgi:hypothetical protein
MKKVNLDCEVLVSFSWCSVVRSVFVAFAKTKDQRQKTKDQNKHEL